ncbi:putative biotin/lipoyl attachment, acetyl-CoA biotin carboxyl carrier, biotin-binding protein [Helianthus anomalus]
MWEVGDKVQKGQVICIIEAMKLMNEIEVTYTSVLSLYYWQERIC